MYPRVTIDMKKLQGNLDACAKLVKEDAGCSMMIVTKCICADPMITELLLNDARVDYLADSRVLNIESYAEEAHAKGKKTCLLRIPMQSELEDVVKFVDLCFNSELSTIRLLNEEAKKQGKVQDILLMIDMGDLREGMFFRNEEQIFAACEEILAMENIHLAGVGVNLTCYGAIIPKADNLGGLAEIAQKIREKFGVEFELVSGGNSSSIYLIWNGGLPEGITNLRLGESFLLGNDTAYGETVPGCVHDAFVLDAQIVELKEKPSLPIGETGVDAFGQKPHYDDRGIMKRAILAVGKQDTDLGGMKPIDPEVEIMGGSSDHTIVNLTDAHTDYKVGDVISFTLEYGALLKLMTSEYVERAYT